MSNDFTVDGDISIDPPQPAGNLRMLALYLPWGDTGTDLEFTVKPPDGLPGEGPHVFPAGQANVCGISARRGVTGEPPQMEAELQAIVDGLPEDVTYSGYLTVHEEYDDRATWRVAVRDRRVVQIHPTVVWPGDGEPCAAEVLQTRIDAALALLDRFDEADEDADTAAIRAVLRPNQPAAALTSLASATAEALAPTGVTSITWADDG